MKKYKTVDEFLQDQSAEKLDQINLVRKPIMGTEPTLIENLKWNAPNYRFHDEDRVTFNLMNREGNVKLILHMGTFKKEDKKGKPVLSEDFGIVEWNSDVRGTISFNNITEIESKTDSLIAIIKGWLKLQLNLQVH
jgi:hypothetical protein